MRKVLNHETNLFDFVLSNLREFQDVNERKKEITATSEPGGGVLRVTVTSHKLEVGDSVTIYEESPYDGTYTVDTVVDDDTFEVTL